MAIKVLIPTVLQKLTKGQPEVELAMKPYCCSSNVNPTNVSAGIKDIMGLLEELNACYPGFKDRVCEETGSIRRFINIYVNGEDIRFLQGQETRIDDGYEVSIVPAIAGG